MKKIASGLARPAAGLVWVCVFLSPAPIASAQDEDRRGWFGVYIGSESRAHDHPYQLEIDVAASPGVVSERLAASMPLSELAALEVEWGLALTDPTGLAAERAWALGNPFVGIDTLLGRIGLVIPSGDPLLEQHGDRLLLHRGGHDPWLFLHHDGALVYQVAAGAEVGHPLFGRLVVEWRIAVAWMLGAASDGGGLGYVGTTLDAFYQYGIFRIGIEQHVGSFTDETLVESTGLYLGVDLDGVEARIGASRSETPDGRTEWTGTLGIGASFD